MNKKLIEFLNQKAREHENAAFIGSDPICIPHHFKKKQDIEIAGFFASIFAWGNRTTIINKATQLMQLMDNEPYDFVRGHSEKDLQKLLGYKHRTFNVTDLLYFILFLRFHYERSDSLETAFSSWMVPQNANVEPALAGFHDYFFSLPDAPVRTKKHIATPVRNSSCKRLNMFLRWMVRSNSRGVDFGLWKQIRPAQLICPVDVHVARVARRYGLITRNQTNWQAAVELTDHLRLMDPADPVKYDFALFGLGVTETKR